MTLEEKFITCSSQEERMCQAMPCREDVPGLVRMQKQKQREHIGHSLYCVFCREGKLRIG